MNVILPTIRQEAQLISSLVIIGQGDSAIQVTVPIIIATLEWPCTYEECEGKCGEKWEIQTIFGLS